MKFCCVEYTTKSRKVWVPSVEHPNYLADPINEIDPTSFGSYTTALRGEHVPLTGAILGHLEGKTLQPFFQQLHWRMFKRWGAYSLNYFRKFDTILAIYDWRRGPELTNFVERARREFPETVVIGVPTQPFGVLRETWRHEQHLSPLVSFYDACHVVLSVVRATVPYQQAMTRTPVVYVPQPYPVEYTLQHWRPGTEKERIVFVAGEIARPDVLAGHLAARAIQEVHPELTIHVTKTPGSPLHTAFLAGAKHEIIPFRPWREHLPYLSQTLLTLNMDNWWTRGRVQVDCAAVGTPSVGGPSDGQQELFPDLLVRDVEDFSSMIELGLRLLGDNAFYERVAYKAKHRLQSYGFEKTAQRFTHLVDLAREGRVSAYPEFVWERDVLVEKKKERSA